ncbi:hypothetical protein FSP39_013645 [Pinctada imbricata]|uniref:Urea active transporter 1 n=1 Tax=Pinctada imbricata TaxID=66713 RepID=A0AA89C5D8_PINIB|nr:hypothetical protein FSP39_013645 [Pinctada imbricata]
MVLGFGGFSVVLAVLHNAIRRHIYKDADSLDTVFDAGGKVSLSLTAVTVTSQLLWPADFLQLPTTTYKAGLGGAFFFVIAIVIDIMLFPMLSLELKTKAPGAKTFLQIIYHRFGKPVHIVFCIIALLTNLVTMTSLILAAKSAITVITKDASDEFIMIVLAILFGSYCFIGGLGTTFYISYFNTALTFFRSRSGAMYGISLLFMATSLSFCDQANWQSRIAAKPTQGVIGFFIAAFLYFSIPMAIGLPATFGYLSKSYQNNGTHLLSSLDINNGFIAPYIIDNVMGSTGGYLLLMMITMALMSTGSGEVMAVSSIIVYDIYKIYVNPFRKNCPPSLCQICGKSKTRRGFSESQICDCVPGSECSKCQTDIALARKARNFEVKYSCPIHGDYRSYESLLMHYKSWCIVWVTLAIIPYGLVLIASNINLHWALYFLQSLLSPFIVPLLLSITWSKCTSQAVIAGSISGLIAAFAGNFIVAELVYDKGLADFFETTASDYSLMGGCISAIIVSVSVTLIVSMVTNKVKSEEDVQAEWEKTISIDNPLNPWRQLYSEELSQFPPNTRINVQHMAKIFKNARYVAYIGGIVCIILFIAVLPGISLSFDVLSFSQFSGWLDFSYIICMIAAVFVVIAPPVEEIIQICRQYQRGKKKTDEFYDSNVKNDFDNLQLNTKM